MPPCLEYAFCRLLSIVVSVTRVVVGGRAGRMFGKIGAPICPGSRPATCGWWRLLMSVVFPADSNAFATARNGTRSKKTPALPRTTSPCDVVGDQAKPNLGDTLL